jgi:adenosylhomocysteinase
VGAGAAINVNDSVTKSKFDNPTPPRIPVDVFIKRATDVMIAGTVWSGYRRGLGPGAAVRCWLQVWVTEIDLIQPPCRYAMKVSAKVVTMEFSLTSAIFLCPPPVTRTSSRPHGGEMKRPAIVRNIGHFDNEIDVVAVVSGRDRRKSIFTDLFPTEKRSSLLAKGRL